MIHQVTLITLLNGLANSVLVVSALHLLIRVFGHPDSVIWRKPWAAILCKLATSITVCGAVSNVLTFSTPPLTELILNIGVSLNFIWLSFYHEYDPKNTTVKRKVGARAKSAANSRKKV
jgi:hypothetical protein